jgi:hypothetical protein
MAPVLFEYGVLDLQGFVVTKLSLCRAVVSGENTAEELFNTGIRISLTPDMEYTKH